MEGKKGRKNSSTGGPVFEKTSPRDAWTSKAYPIRERGAEACQKDGIRAATPEVSQREDAARESADDYQTTGREIPSHCRLRANFREYVSAWDRADQWLVAACWTIIVLSFLLFKKFTKDK